jgi:hypothetical protein
VTAPLPGDPAFRCARSSALRDDTLGGTASTVRAYLLIEHPGSWGEDALRDARLPDGLGSELRRRAHEAGIRVLLIRRTGRRPASDGTTVFAAHADPYRPWIERGTVSNPADVLDLDFFDLRAGHPTSLTAHDESLFCVCTHGRHDACCAEQGRPVVTALAAAHPEETWEVSHIGGDRFAGNLLVLPNGLYYGRLDPVSAVAVAGAHVSGQLDLDHFRGRSGFPTPIQAAEIALRRDLGETREGALRLRSRHREGVDTEAVFVVGGQEYVVEVHSAWSEQPNRLTCKAQRDNPIPQHTVTGIHRR